MFESLTVAMGSSHLMLPTGSVAHGLGHLCVSGALLSVIALVITHSHQLKSVATRIRSRMELLGLNETQLSERCSLAAIDLFEDDDAPSLRRDRIAKILMNRQEVPAKSAAHKITHRELAVLANVLKVSPEWLLGQEENRDPVVWNVLAEPNRVQNFVELLQEYEELGKQTTIWSRFPLYPFVSDDFVNSFNQAYYGGKDASENSRPMVEFSNNLARARRKWIVRPNRTFDFISLIYQSDFEQVVGGRGIYSSISRSVLTRNIQVMIDIITNASFNMSLVILKDDPSTTERLRGFDLLGTVDDLFSAWTYHNGDIGWSEHSVYVEHHRKLLELLASRPQLDATETLELLESLRSKIRCCT
jgi:transcriptional regulator with XRE-family HTH domain